MGSDAGQHRGDAAEAGTGPGPSPRRALGLLRHFSFTCGDVEIPFSAPTQRLLALLAIEARPVRRSVVAGMLWPEMTQHRALANVRRALWRLPEPCGRPLVDEQPSGLTLASDIDVDTQRRRAVVERLEHGLLCSEMEIDDLRSELLPDWSEEWTDGERERCRQDGLHGLDAAAVVAAEHGRFALATRIGLTAVELDPLRESSHRSLMRVHLMEGNLVDARRRYDAYLALLIASGLEPVVSEQTRALVAQLLPITAGTATPARRRTDAGYPSRAAGSA